MLQAKKETKKRLDAPANKNPAPKPIASIRGPNPMEPAIRPKYMKLL